MKGYLDLKYPKSFHWKVRKIRLAITECDQ